MALCDDLKNQLAETERRIVEVEAALDATTDPDEALALANELAQLQAQRTQLKILINQQCRPAALAAAGSSGLGLASSSSSGGPPKPNVKAILARARAAIKSGKALLAKHPLKKKPATKKKSK